MSGSFIASGNQCKAYNEKKRETFVLLEISLFPKSDSCHFWHKTFTIPLKHPPPPHVFFYFSLEGKMKRYLVTHEKTKFHSNWTLCTYSPANIPKCIKTFLWILPRSGFQSQKRRILRTKENCIYRYGERGNNRRNAQQHRGNAGSHSSGRIWD